MPLRAPGRGGYARGMRRVLLPSLLLVLIVSALQPRVSGQAPALRGFPADSVAAQRALEEKFRAVPDPARMREHMRVMTAEPHVAGRPSSKKVAEYALQQF